MVLPIDEGLMFEVVSLLEGTIPVKSVLASEAPISLEVVPLLAEVIAAEARPSPEGRLMLVVTSWRFLSSAGDSPTVTQVVEVTVDWGVVETLAVTVMVVVKLTVSCGKVTVVTLVVGRWRAVKFLRFPVALRNVRYLGNSSALIDVA